jgi:hypothetical protein
MATTDSFLDVLRAAEAERDALRSQLEALEQEDARAIDRLSAEARALAQQRNTIEEEAAPIRARIAHLEAERQVALTPAILARKAAQTGVRLILALCAILGALMIPAVTPGATFLLTIIVNAGVIWGLGDFVDRAELSGE